MTFFVGVYPHKLFEIYLSINPVYPSIHSILLSTTEYVAPKCTPNLFWSDWIVIAANGGLNKWLDVFLKQSAAILEPGADPATPSEPFQTLILLGSM